MADKKVNPGTSGSEEDTESERIGSSEVGSDEISIADVASESLMDGKSKASKSKLAKESEVQENGSPDEESEENPSENEASSASKTSKSKIADESDVEEVEGEEIPEEKTSSSSVKSKTTQSKSNASKKSDSKVVAEAGEDNSPGIVDEADANEGDVETDKENEVTKVPSKTDSSKSKKVVKKKSSMKKVKRDTRDASQSSTDSRTGSKSKSKSMTKNSAGSKKSSATGGSNSSKVGQKPKIKSSLKRQSQSAAGNKPSKMQATQNSLALSKRTATDVGHDIDQKEQDELEELDKLVNKYGLDDSGPDEEGDDNNEEVLNQSQLLGVTPSGKKIIKKRTDVSSDAESSPVTDIDEFERPTSPEFPAEYWQVQRLVKYIKAGNPTATIIALSALRDYNLKDNYIQMSIRDSQGLEVLLNILETDENRCKIAALLILKEITINPDISRYVFNMRGLDTLVESLKDPAREIKLLAAETIANVAKLRKARRALRKGDGIYRLVDMLELNQSHLHYNVTVTHNHYTNVDFELARAGSMALWSVARSTKNKDAIRRAGGIPLLAKLLKCRNVSVIVPVTGTLHECATEPSFRLAIRTEGLLEEFVHGLRSPNHQLVQFSASAIHQCAEDPVSRQRLYHMGVVDPLMHIIKDPTLRKDKPLLAAATGAIWKLSILIAKDRKYLNLAFIELLVELLHDEPENVLINVAGSLDQILKTDPINCLLLKAANAIPFLVDLLTINNPVLLVNATQAVGELAREPETRKEMDLYDGFRLLWALLKHPSSEVQASAAWAICPYVESSEESGDIVRNFVGGLEALVQLLGSDDPKVQSAVSKAVAVIATNQDNLAIMSDHGVVIYLARLAPTTDDNLRKSVAEAIAQCCKWKNNSTEFGRRNAVSPICCYLNSDDPEVHRSAAKALCGLSNEPKNCIVMHQCGVVPHLINMVGSGDNELQEGAACTLYNIRKLALNVEKVRLR